MYVGYARGQRHSTSQCSATKCATALKALSTLSQKSETVAENGETTATVALFCDSVDRA